MQQVGNIALTIPKLHRRNLDSEMTNLIQTHLGSLRQSREQDQFLQNVFAFPHSAFYVTAQRHVRLQCSPERRGVHLQKLLKLFHTTDSFWSRHSSEGSHGSAVNQDWGILAELCGKACLGSACYLFFSALLMLLFPYDKALPPVILCLSFINCPA